MDFKDFLHINKLASSATTAYVRSVVIIGENPDVDTGSVPEDIWESGGSITLPTSATVATLVSTDVNDTSAGTGARTVLIEGVDSNYRQLVEVVSLNGTSNVTSTNQFFRINFLRVISSGSIKTNVGNITATVNGNIISTIASGESLAHTAVFTVPKEHTLFLTQSSYGIIRAASAGYATISVKVFVSDTNTIVNSGYFVVDGQQFAVTNHSYAVPNIPEKCDIRYVVESVSANNTNVVVSVRGLLINNAYLSNIKGFNNE